ncbi:hypothetical protein J6590_083335 [Homalodisca vitripennis]|nr:hypothetical protein J6590_083335 [Homalodisca vitripennis]
MEILVSKRNRFKIDNGSVDSGDRLSRTERIPQIGHSFTNSWIEESQFDQSIQPEKLATFLRTKEMGRKFLVMLLANGVHILCFLDDTKVKRLEEPRGGMDVSSTASWWIVIPCVVRSSLPRILLCSNYQTLLSCYARWPVTSQDIPISGGQDHQRRTLMYQT